jgi:hypothetical protein
VHEIGDPALVDYAGDQANARRALQARIDAALKVIDDMLVWSPINVDEDDLRHIRAALLGEATGD